MARITLIPIDGRAGIDGEFRSIDFTGIDPTIHAVQWKDTKGRIEYNDDKAQELINDISPFQVFLDRWTAAAPPPPPPPPTDDEIYDQALANDRVFKALLVSLDNGDFMPGQLLGGAAVKAVLKPNM